MSIFDRLFGGHHGGGHYSGGHRDNYGGGNNSDRSQPPSVNSGIACPNCNALNSQGAKFCQQCGASLIPSGCKQCGTSLPPGAKFCSRCGTAA